MPRGSRRGRVRMSVAARAPVEVQLAVEFHGQDGRVLVEVGGPGRVDPGHARHLVQAAGDAVAQLGARADDRDAP